MPELSFDRIISVSCEEKKFPADNLLRQGEFKKWKCSSGESQAVVILQLKEASKIERITIGNEGSAFVEVFVGKSSSKGDDFQIILVASSFMTPAESRNNQNLSKVRFFDKDHLSKATLDEKWDVIKVVCSQPFNKNIQYGLSFITLHSPPSPSTNQAAVDLGACLLKSESASSFKVGSLFERNKQKETASLSNSIAAEIRHASAAKIKVEEAASSASAREIDKQASGKDSAETTSNYNFHSEPPTKKFKEDKNDSRKETLKQKKEFKSLMQGVVIVLSGFQNPLRGELRDKALMMGAKYKADWGEGCTHLVCAFEKTPKYSQVKGLGKIVKSEWIIDSYNKKQLMPWRDYRLGKAPSPKKIIKSVSPNFLDEEKEQQNKITKQTQDRTDDDIFDASTDSECNLSDEDDDMARKQESAALHVKAKNGRVADDIENDGLPELPNFLEGLKFMLYGNFTPEDRRCMRRHIIAYGGCLVDYMNNDVTAVITCQAWDSNFDQALEDNPRMMFLRPDWLVECIEQQKRAPFTKFQITTAS